MGEQWHRVADAAEVEEEVTVDGTSIGVYRLGEDLHAIEDICPHAYALLSEGFIDGDTAMVFVTIIMLTVIGILAYVAVIALGRRVLHYLHVDRG